MRSMLRRALIAAVLPVAVAGPVACGPGNAAGHPAAGAGADGEPSDGAASVETNDAPVAAAPAGLTAAVLSVAAGLASAPFDRPRQVLVPPGWTMTVWARVPGARLAVWAPDGTLLVSRPDAGQVVRLAGDPGRPPETSVLLDGLNEPHGLAFDGETLYVAQTDRVDAYDYAAGWVGSPRVVVSGLPNPGTPGLDSYQHPLKSVAIGRDKSIYVSVGSTGNISAEDRTADPRRAVILRVPPGGGNPEVFAQGVRNGVGLAIAPDGSVWTAVNNRDDIAYPFARAYSGGTGSDLGKIIPAYVADHPPEELARLVPGRDLGWPYCNPDPDVAPGAPGSPMRDAAPRFVRDVQTNPHGDKLDCAALPPIDRTFGAHAAPLGLSFTSGLPAPYQDGALVGIHGSWDRIPPRAPEVSFFPWVNGTLGPQRTLVGGFQSADGSRWGRPVAAVRGPDGSIYITDDTAGAVYRLVPPPA